MSELGLWLRVDLEVDAVLPLDRKQYKLIDQAEEILLIRQETLNNGLWRWKVVVCDHACATPCGRCPID